MMRSTLYIVVAMALLTVGCRSIDSLSRPSTSALGEPVRSLIQACAGHRIEIFDSDGKKLQHVPRQQEGSVSIYNRDQSGQDNYAFDENGSITRHQRSDGTNYAQGVWEDVE